jgi:organic hydroperoxide reductase OsmC/OhrA
MKKQHTYQLNLTWTGNKGNGTTSYHGYSRDHLISIPNKPTISGSSDPAFLGDYTRYNPEELLLASLAACHMLWYLHLCADAGIIVTSYQDIPSGIMLETSDGGGHFIQVTLNPNITITAKEKIPLAHSLHHKANQLCFIANSVKFPVNHNAIISA